MKPRNCSSETARTNLDLEARVKEACNKSVCLKNNKINNVNQVHMVWSASLHWWQRQVEEATQGGSCKVDQVNMHLSYTQQDKSICCNHRFSWHLLTFLPLTKIVSYKNNPRSKIYFNNFMEELLF